MSGRHRIEASIQIAGLHGRAVIQAVHGREEVSHPFRYQVDLTADEIMIEEARGTIASVLIKDHRGQMRHVSGVVEQIEVLAGDSDGNRFRLHLVPLPYLLSYRHGFRIFQGLSVPEIVKKVLQDAGIDEKYLATRLSARYSPREFCVQYDESEWDFICRLLEEEGIWFAFDQTQDGHAMVLCDSSPDAEPAEPESLPYHHDADLHGDTVRAWGFSGEARVVVKKVGIDGYDFLRPSTDLFTEMEAEDGEGSWYEHRRPFVTPATGSRWVKTRLEELRAERSGAIVTTSAFPIQAGRTIDLTGHPAAGSWFVKSVVLGVRLEEEKEGGPLVEAGPVTGHSELELFPGERVFRPARRTPRPVIAGLQTARVVGPPGEEIHCDAHGRVKLLFHWDSEGKNDEHASCWIRVAQQHTTGTLMLPRIGWEVLVEFLNGDPDHPVCRGRLFNPLTPPPYELPAGKTVTAHRSNSSPGAAGVNELRFDDAAGQQEVWLNAHRDFNVSAENDHHYHVASSDTRVVGGNRTVLVGSDGPGIEVVKVGGLSARVEGDEHVDVGSRWAGTSGSDSEEVKGNFDLVVGQGSSLHVGNPGSALLKAAEVNGAELAGNLLQKFAVGKLGLDKAVAAAKGDGTNTPKLNLLQNTVRLGAKYYGKAKGLFDNYGPLLGAKDNKLYEQIKTSMGDADTIGKNLLGVGAAMGASKLTGVGADPGFAGDVQSGKASGGQPAASGSTPGGSTPGGSTPGGSTPGGGTPGGGTPGGGTPGGGTPGGAKSGGASGGSSGAGNAAAGAKEQKPFSLFQLDPTPAKGIGTWNMKVGGNQKETIGNFGTTLSGIGMSLAVKGSSKESSWVRLLAVPNGGIKEEVGKDAIELVGGLSMTLARKGITYSAKGVMATTAIISQRLSTSKNYTLKGTKLAYAKSIRVALKSESDTLTLSCGEAKVIISSCGIKLVAKKITIEATEKITLDPPAINS